MSTLQRIQARLEETASTHAYGKEVPEVLAAIKTLADHLAWLNVVLEDAYYGRSDHPSYKPTGAASKKKSKALMNMFEKFDSDLEVLRSNVLNAERLLKNE